MGKQWDKGNYCDIIPDVIFGVDLKDCCYCHDVHYWKKDITRKEADEKVRECMIYKFTKKKLKWFGFPFAWLCYGVLRIGGWIKW